jgi:uncharacterized protein YjbJ (UPF0337 family)
MGAERKHRRLPNVLLPPETSRSVQMVDKDRIKGSAKQVGGKAKEIAGKVTGDTKTENEGKADQLTGKVQNTVGGMKDAIRGK